MNNIFPWMLKRQHVVNRDKDAPTLTDKALTTAYLAGIIALIIASGIIANWLAP